MTDERRYFEGELEAPFNREPSETQRRRIEGALTAVQTIEGVWWEEGGSAIVRVRLPASSRAEAVGSMQKLIEHHIRGVLTERDDVGLDLQPVKVPNALLDGGAYP